MKNGVKYSKEKVNSASIREPWKNDLNWEWRTVSCDLFADVLFS